MKEITEMLNDKKSEMEQLEVPEELETRLHNAIKEKTNLPGKRKGSWIIKIAAMLLILIVAGSHSDTLAYYGKKIMGYEQVMNGTLQQLNEQGKGQEVGKSYTFENGMSITLDGIMLDDNQFLAFYTLTNIEGYPDNYNYPLYIDGLSGKHKYYMNSSTGEMNETKTEIKYLASFETPDSSEKELGFAFRLEEEGINESGEINFKIDRHKAMASSLKIELNQVVKVDSGKIRFKSLAASPTTTVIKGSIQNIFELAIDQITGNRVRTAGLNVKLIANGKEVPWQGGSVTSDMKGITFQQEYDALPADLEQLQIQLVSSKANHDVHQKIELQKDGGKQTVEILGQSIDINKVYESRGDTYVTITTEESTILSRVYLLIDGEKTGLEETIKEDYTKKPDGTITHTRTMHFSGTGEKLRLDIEQMMYTQKYNQVIDIPVK